MDEVTDLEVITIAKHLRDEHRAGSDHPDIIIVSNDEGIQRATDHFLKGDVKVLEPAVFLSVLLGVTDDKAVQDEIAETSLRLFRYFTAYRASTGRAPIRQLDAFFQEIQSAIRLARADFEPYFEQGTIQAFERYIISGDPFPNRMVSYEPTLAIIKGLLALPNDEFLAVIDDRLHELFLALGSLARSLHEPNDFTRFYNYITTYLIRAYLDAFKICFLGGDLAAAYKYMTLAKALVQCLANQPSAQRLYFSLLIAEASFAIITGHVGDNYVESTIEFLANAIKKRQLPTLISPDQVFLLIAIWQCKKQKGIDVRPGQGRDCEYRETGLRCTRDYFSALLLHIEEFCDELTSFGKHELALAILMQVYKVVRGESDESSRIEGKIYLICLILQQAIPSCVGSVFPASWEQTTIPLAKDDTHVSFTPLDMASNAYKNQIKILSYIPATGAYTCWVYPLKSRFTLVVPVEVEIKAPARLKAVKLLAGSIKVTPATSNAGSSQGVRGTIELGKDCKVQAYYYEDKFFTLNVI
ncbi:MAG: hypothetical protein GYA24_17270 [Candidatus Lokiarchaeota archaeon]|nr:hypothetical protein [Candidatus Lokiarchaeota archaeon]